MLLRQYKHALIIARDQCLVLRIDRLLEAGVR